jgi:transposase-like protein
MMADNWGFVAAAYGLTAAALLAYWRRLARRERQLDAVRRPRP